MVTVSGLIYNLGLVVGPWFEGQLAQCLLGILNGNETFAAMAALCAGYLIAIAVVQGSRFIKRLYVRKFANNINRSMKQVLYANLVRKGKVELEQAGTGTLMTKAISDVDACAEGMRKFTTEIFDTGIALLAYAVMLLGYDWRLALLCLVFAPISYYIAEQMKTLVQRTGAANKESTGRLSAATLDRVSGALTYRVYGCEPQRDAAYEACLQEYLSDCEDPDLKARLNGNSKYNLDYYFVPTEVFARCGELYFTRFRGVDNSLLRFERGFDYPENEKLLELIKKYYDQHFLTEEISA